MTDGRPDRFPLPFFSFPSFIHTPFAILIRLGDNFGIGFDRVIS